MKKLSLILLVMLLSVAILFSFTSCNKDEKKENQSDENNDHVHSYVVEDAKPETMKTVATCTAKAVYYKSCSCGEIGTETFEYGDFGAHNFDREVAEAKYLYEEATCTDPDYYYCSCACGEVGYAVFDHGEPLGHSFDGYVCQACDAERSSDGLILQFNEPSGRYIVVGYDENIPEDLYISTYNGIVIESIAERAFKNCTAIKRVTFSGRLHDIWHEAFYGCTNLESVHFGEYAVNLGTGVFAYCPSLVEFTVSEKNQVLKVVNNCILEEFSYQGSDSALFIVAGCNSSVIPTDMNIKFIFDKAFLGASNLTSVVIPDSVHAISVSAFEDCTGLKELTLGSGIEILYDSVFRNCTGLEKLDYNIIADITSNSGSEFANIGANSDGITLTISNQVRTLPSAIFCKDTNITTVIFESGSILESIPSYAFANSSVTSITLPDSVTSIGDAAFNNCTKLRSFNAGNSVTEIPDDCFEYCSSLVNLTLNNVTKIGEGAFYYCTSLVEFISPDSLTTIMNGAFADCTSLASLKIGKNVSYVGSGAFDRNYALSYVYFNAASLTEFDCTFFLAGIESDGIEVVIGKDATAVPERMFGGTVRIVSVTFEENSVCTTIGKDAFSYNNRLISVTIPASVTEFKNAFEYCTSLVEVYNLSSTELVVGSMNSGIEWYLLSVHTSLSEPSNLVYDGDFVFHVDGDERLLVGYVGTDKKLTLPASCQGHSYKINVEAFYRSEIEEVIISDGVTEIGVGAFESSALTKVVIGRNVTLIDFAAFQIFTLEEVIIPANVAVIRSNAFAYVDTIYCEASAKPERWEDYEYYLWSGVGEEKDIYWFSSIKPTTEGNWWRYVNGVPTPWETEVSE